MSDEDFEIKNFSEEKLGFQLTLILEKKKILFFPQQIGKLMNYSNLAHSILNSQGFIKEIDYLVVDGAKLNIIKKLARSISDTAQPQNLFSSIKFSPSLLLITESGFYALTFRSNKPKCIKFRIWVTSKVLPTIRQTGRYEKDSTEDNNLLKTQLASINQSLLQIQKSIHCLQNEKNVQTKIAQIKSDSLSAIEIANALELKDN